MRKYIFKLKKNKNREWELGSYVELIALNGFIYLFHATWDERTLLVFDSEFAD